MDLPSVRKTLEQLHAASRVETDRVGPLYFRPQKRIDFIKQGISLLAVNIHERNASLRAISNDMTDFAGEGARVVHDVVITDGKHAYCGTGHHFTLEIVKQPGDVLSPRYIETEPPRMRAIKSNEDAMLGFMQVNDLLEAGVSLDPLEQVDISDEYLRSAIDRHNAEPLQKATKAIIDTILSTDIPDMYLEGGYYQERVYRETFDGEISISRERAEGSGEITSEVIWARHKDQCYLTANEYSIGHRPIKHGIAVAHTVTPYEGQSPLYLGVENAHAWHGIEPEVVSKSVGLYRYLAG